MFFLLYTYITDDIYIFNKLTSLKYCETSLLKFESNID